MRNENQAIDYDAYIQKIPGLEKKNIRPVVDLIDEVSTNLNSDDNEKAEQTIQIIKENTVKIIFPAIISILTQLINEEESCQDNSIWLEQALKVFIDINEDNFSSLFSKGNKYKALIGKPQDAKLAYISERFEPLIDDTINNIVITQKNLKQFHLLAIFIFGAIEQAKATKGDKADKNSFDNLGVGKQYFSDRFYSPVAQTLMQKIASIDSNTHIAHQASLLNQFKLVTFTQNNQDQNYFHVEINLPLSQLKKYPELLKYLGGLLISDTKLVDQFTFTSNQNEINIHAALPINLVDKQQNIETNVNQIIFPKSISQNKPIILQSSLKDMLTKIQNKSIEQQCSFLFRNRFAIKLTEAENQVMDELRIKMSTTNTTYTNATTATWGTYVKSFFVERTHTEYMKNQINLINMINENDNAKVLKHVLDTWSYSKECKSVELKSSIQKLISDILTEINRLPEQQIEYEYEPKQCTI